MVDRETAITHLQIIHTWAEFAREYDLNFFTKKHLEDIAQWTDDALELLKEQEKTRLEIAHEMISNSILMYQGKELIQCKDCKHAQRMCQPWSDLVCEKNGQTNRPDFYCADGERKKGR